MKTTTAGRVTLLTTALLLMVAGCAVPHKNNGVKSKKDRDDAMQSAEVDRIEELVVSGNLADRRHTAEEKNAQRRVTENARKQAVGAAAPARMLEMYTGNAAQDAAASVTLHNAHPLVVALAPPPFAQTDRENYAHLDESALKITALEPVSTFSIDVDSGSYANVRRFLHSDRLPPQDAVRVEELINYFSYDYPVPARDAAPFSVSTELATTPWNADTWLLQVGLKGFEIPADQRPAANLVFLLDVSGSMNSADKLPLLKKSFNLLTRQLHREDRISIVVYAGASGVVLEPTPGDQRRTILAALQRLRAGGSTNGAAGINLAYELAQEAFIDDGINRIILATDGDFNVGTVNFEQLKDLAERKRASGVSLTTLGFGSGNYNDHLLEQLADAGNGNYAYIDSLSEARKVLVNEVASTLITIANDVKIQIEFNPEVVAEYRLIGYENRALKREDFRNDKVDAGEIGAGHTVTALYELTPVNSQARLVEPLRYAHDATTKHALNNEIAFLRLRYKQPNGDVSTQITRPIAAGPIGDVASSSVNLRLAAAVSAFGQMLKGSVYTGEFGFADIRELASTASGNDPHGYRREFLELIDLADDLHERHASSTAPDSALAISGQ